MKGRLVLKGPSGRKVAKKEMFRPVARQDTPEQQERLSFRSSSHLTKEMWEDYHHFKAAFMLHEWRVKWGLLDSNQYRKAAP